MNGPLSLRGLAVRAVTVATVTTLTLAACTDAPISATVRSLQSSGPVAFLCLDAPGLEVTSMARPLDNCSGTRTATIDDYDIPHLYAMVTQLHSGEVAVIDLTTESGAVLDQDPAVPGANFLPVGAQPTAIVTTPGGMATFVAAGEPRYEGIYALPSNMIRDQAPRLTSWPACRLPAAPGEITIAVDPANDDGEIRPRCEAAYGAEDSDAECENEAHCHGDLSVDADSLGTPGRYKLIVTLPSEGGFAVIDAQAILDQEAGAFEPCDIERWVPLEVELPAPPDDPPEPTDPPGWCVQDPPNEGPFADAFVPLPAGIAHDGSRLYVADLAAPVIHRIEMPTPCEPVEIPPLVASSTEQPDRIVTTSRIAISPPTLDLKRFLYAIDHTDGSIMAFDVSEGVDVTRPLVHPNPENNPFQPTDRVRYQTPPRDIIILQHQTDSVDDQTGATLPVRCDPDPDLSSSAPGATYRTSSAYDSGASPSKLRGVFAFAVLASGDIVVIDIDDYDAPCRGPTDEHSLYGCGDEQLASGLKRSGEYSCNVVAPHQSRARGYLLTADGVANNQPGIAAFPTLFDPEGTLIHLDDEDVISPRMRATTPVELPPKLDLVVGSAVEQIDPATGLLTSASGTLDPNDHTLVTNLSDPRAHILSQNWTATYEGKLPGFSARFAALYIDPEADAVLLHEGSSQFCSRGVLGQNAITEELIDQGSTTAEAASLSAKLADYVQLDSDTPVASDGYWNDPIGECTFQACKQTFGTSKQPRLARDFRIIEATETTLELVTRTTPVDGAPALDCCFPAVVQFSIRAGEQWVVFGDAVGFLHNVTTNDLGQCRKACDPNQALLTGRVREAPTDTPIADDDPVAFHNPFFRFAINHGDSLRDMAFRFTTQSHFSPLAINTATGELEVQPTRATYLPSTGEIVISDGSIEGITFLDLSALTVTRQYF